MSLSDIQVKLSSIQDQNFERDATLKQLQEDVKEMKGSKRVADDVDGPKSKKSRKSPCGLSVSVIVVALKIVYIMTVWLLLFI